MLPTEVTPVDYYFYDNYEEKHTINAYQKALFVAVILFSAFFAVRYMIHSLVVEKSVKYADTSDVKGKIQEANLSNSMEAESENENETNNGIEDITSFIPKDWEILKQGDESAIAEGDLNKDGIIDKAFVVTEKEKSNSSDYAAQRNLIIIFGNSDGGYDLSITAKNAILLANEGGTFGDPFDGIAIDRGSVLLKFISTIKNKAFLKLGVLCLLFFLLCSCNKNDGNVNDDIEVVNKDDNISEDITKPNLEEALTKVQVEVKLLTGRDDVETSEFFSFENTHYIKVKIHDLMLHYDYIYADNGESTAFTAYTDRSLNNIEEKISGDYYEIWRYENGDIKRILYNMENVVYSYDEDKIIIDGAYNSYIIKSVTDNDGKMRKFYMNVIIRKY